MKLWPLLTRKVKVTRLVFEQPRIRVLRDTQGRLDVSTIGKGTEKATPAKPANIGAENKAAALGAPSIEDFSVQGDDLVYSDAQNAGAVIEIKHLDLDVMDFSATAPFGIKLKLAALSDQRNFSVEGKAGPILSDGSLAPGKLPLDLKIGIGPLLLDKLRSAPQIGSKIPAASTLSVKRVRVPD